MPEAGRGVVLVGLPGSGKSTVGRLLAERLGRPFRDTDELIQQRSGAPAHEVLRRRGEPAFRALEREAVEAVCAEPGSVVATGGGALNDPLNRWRLWEHGRAIWLQADKRQLVDRLGRDGTPRPLLDGDAPANLASLAEARAPFYRAADAVVDAGVAPPQVADAVATAIEQGLPAGRRLFDAEEPRNHVMGPTHARVVLGRNLAAVAGDELRDLGGTPSIVVDRRAMAHMPAVGGRCLSIRGGERTKRLRSLERIHEWLAAEGAERTDPLLAVGGGTVGDLAGFAAATYARGVPYVAVPTTWLAQLDAAIGGKVAVDLAAGKNLVGAFWPAWAVLADVAALRTLPRARLRDGVAEAVKAGIIGDAALWRLVADRGREALGGDESLRHAITERAVRVKLAIVRRDPFERGERRVLNLGHTIGHALEAEAGYRLAHGDAVALGMRGVAAIAAGRGADPALTEELDEVLASMGFPLTHRIDPEAIKRGLRTDKKRTAGRQRWLLPMAIGRVEEVDDITDRELDRALAIIAED